MCFSCHRRIFRFFGSALCKLHDSDTTMPFPMSFSSMNSHLFSQPLCVKNTIIAFTFVMYPNLVARLNTGDGDGDGDGIEFVACAPTFVLMISGANTQEVNPRTMRMST